MKKNNIKFKNCVNWFSILFLCGFFTIYLFVHIKYLINNDYFAGDEQYYLRYVKNLSNGYYTTKIEKDLWYGPGYPIFLYILTFIKLSISQIRFTNLVILLIAFVLNLVSIKRFTQNSLLVSAVYSALLLPWVYDAVDFYRIHTESLTYLLISLIIYCFISFKTKNNKKLILFGLLAIGYLTITKVFFIYILIVTLLFYLIFNPQLLFKFKFYILISIIPASIWFFYTYSITNKLFYAGSSGGKQLYFMTTTLNKEVNSNWVPTYEALKGPDSIVFNVALEKKMNPYEEDVYLKQISIINIKSNPFLYLRRIMVNSSRLFYYNLSRDSVLPTFLGLKHYLIFFLIVILEFFSIKTKSIKKIEFLPLLFILIYLFMSTLIIANSRFFIVCYPLVIYSLNYQIVDKKKFENHTSNDKYLRS